jgi:DNA-binding MltR family transcriptional regulator
MPKKMKTFPLPENLKKHFIPLFSVLFGAQDLSCALLATAFVDHCLASVLQNYLVDGETTKEIMQPRGMLGEFVGRAKIAYCLGLIQKSILEEVRAIAEIRNEFAHELFKVSFTDDDIKKKCAKLKYIEKVPKPEQPAKMVWLETPELKAEDDPRSRFINSILILAVQLLGIAMELEHRKRKSERDWPVLDLNAPIDRENQESGQSS